MTRLYPRECDVFAETVSAKYGVPGQDAVGGVRRIAVSADAVRTFMDEEIPFPYWNDRQNDAPDLEELCDLAAANGGWVEGYVVLPPREDARVSLDTLVIQARSPGDALAKLFLHCGERPAKPNVIRSMDDGLWRLWWD